MYCSRNCEVRMLTCQRRGDKVTTETIGISRINQGDDPGKHEYFQLAEERIR